MTRITPRVRMELIIFAFLGLLYLALRFFGVVKPIPPLSFLAAWVFLLVVLLDAAFDERMEEIRDRLERIERKLSGTSN
jgi:hypothetical protein